MNKSLLLSLFFLGLQWASAQENQDIIINNHHFSVQEFKDNYNRNIESEGLEKALHDFIDFKLMSIYAIDKQVDTTSYFKNNWKLYREDQSKNYLESESLKEKLAAKIYEGLKTEKRIEFFNATDKYILNPTELKKVKSDFALLKTQICDQQDSVSVQNYRAKNQSSPFWTKPFTLPYQIEEAIRKTAVGECSSIIEEDFNSYFVKILEEKKVENLPPYEHIKNNLINGISQTSYNEILQDDLVARIQDHIEFTENRRAIEEVAQVFQNNIKTNQKVDFSGDKIIWKTTHTTYNQKDLLATLNEEFQDHDAVKKEEFKYLLTYLIPILKQDFIIQSYKDHLEEFEPTFAKNLNLMRETLYVNYFIEKYVYQEAEKDSIGQALYLKQNSDQYQWPKRYDLTIYRFYDNKVEKELKRLIKQEKNHSKILNYFNQPGQKPVVVITNGKLSTKNPQLPTQFNPNKKIQKGTYLTQPAIYVVNDILAPRTMTVKEAGLPFLEAYKGAYYNQKLEELRNKAEITIPKSLQE
ncbi:MAG: peptidylprolyl isomerase [Weeksellaceae bacterium]